MDDQIMKANVFAINHLKKMIRDDLITSEYDIKFISNMEENLKMNFKLSSKQQDYLDVLFHEKY